MASERPAFHLAWHEEDAQRLARGGPLQYVLVPVGLGTFLGAKSFEAISDTGRPVGEILANQHQLRSLRSPGTVAGEASPVERVLVSSLRSRAQRAGYILPEILLTIHQPGWSCLDLTVLLRRKLERVGGA
jgi:hypothetical protein